MARGGRGGGFRGVGSGGFWNPFRRSAGRGGRRGFRDNGGFRRAMLWKATADNLEKSIYTTSKPDSLTHTCVVAFDKTHAASFHHGPHSQLKRDEKVILYNLRDTAIQFETRVLAINEFFDVTVFELLSGEFPNYPRASEPMFGGQTYMQLGITPDRVPSWKDGIVSRNQGVFSIGTAHGQLGDSGSGIFSDDGYFLGIAIGKKDFVYNDFQNFPMREVADHHPDSIMIDSKVILVVAGITGPANNYGPT